jgi:putative transposase
MDDYESLGHSNWECKYHGVFIPKYRRKTLYGELRQHLGEVFRRLIQKKSRVEEGHLMPDHVHMMISIQRPHRAALSGPKPKAPGFAGGYLLPGLGVKLSNDHPCRAHCSLRGRGKPSA